MTPWLLMAALTATAGDLAGVTMPDSCTVGGETLTLNGMGLREKYYIDVYVGGLYLPSKTSSGADAAAAAGAKRVQMNFIYKQVTAEQQCESFVEGFEKVSGGSMSGKVQELCGMLPTVVAGDVVQFDFDGNATSVTVNGANKGSIAGADFGKGLVNVFVGGYPPTAKLRKGMLRG